MQQHTAMTFSAYKCIDSGTDDTLELEIKTNNHTFSSVSNKQYYYVGITYIKILM